MLLRFITLFPEDPLTPIIRGFLLYRGLPTLDEVEGEEKVASGEHEVEDENYFALVLVSRENPPLTRVTAE